MVGVVAVVAEVALDLVAAVDAAVEAVVAWVLVELVELVVLVAAAMQPVSATIPTTLDTPATRRAFRAGCGRRRRTGVRCATALGRGADFGVSGPGGRGWADMVAPFDGCPLRAVEGHRAVGSSIWPWDHLGDGADLLGFSFRVRPGAKGAART
ncbi:MAG: hypothetical protein QOF59_2261 [Actinomycetota bacterium]|nr:hypothetical protein [Actinomycetota bacterium]